MIDTIEQDVCKTVRSLGLSPVRTRRVVDGVSRDISNNGPEWVISRVKDLRSYYSGDGEFPGWIKYKTRPDGLVRPSGWMGSLVGPRTDPKTAITALSTVIGAIRFSEPTVKQLSKWKDAVIDPPKPADISDEFAFLRDSKLESSLKSKLDKVKPFGPDDIGGTRIPIGFESLHVKRGRTLDASGLYRAFQGSVESAPTAAWVFQDQSGVRIPGLSTAKSRPILNALRKSAPDSKVRKPKTSSKRSGRPLPPLEGYPVGHISFLQEPFGKLRTVANPNRFVQWQLTPLGEVLSDWVNSKSGVFVKDQEAGIAWVQRQLELGITIASMDLSSASDTLDFVQITEALKKSGKEIRKHLEYFEKCSKMSWSVTNDIARSFIGSSTIQWKQGQPLGLRPSFPILTITNWAAAHAAVKRVDGRYRWSDPPFAIVGDDIAMHSEYASAYSEIISALGGVVNLEKSMLSHNQAEFCSRLIRPDDVIRLKARYLHDNDPQNLLTYQDTDLKVSMKPWVRRMAMRVGSYSLVESGAVPEYHPSQPKRTNIKELFHVRLSLDSGKTTKREISSQSMWYASIELARSERLTRTVRTKKGRGKKPTPSLIDASRAERFKKFKEWNPTISLEELPILLGLVKSYYPNTHERWMNQALRELEISTSSRARVPGVIWPEDHEYKTLVREFEEVSARKQTVDTVRTSFSYKDDARIPVSNPDKTLSRLNRKVEHFEKDLITDDSGAHLISQIGPNVDMLVEEEEDGFAISFHSPSKSTVPYHVGTPLRDVPNTDDSLSSDRPYRRGQARANRRKDPEPGPSI